MKLIDDIYVLEIPTSSSDNTSSINPVLVNNNGELILIDTGYPGQLTQIKDLIKKEGLSFSDLSTIILTHQDIDHIGNVNDILNELPQTKIIAYEDEEKYMNGTAIPSKLYVLEKNFELLDDNMKSFYNKLKSFFDNNKFKVMMTLKDYDELPYAGGITVVFTPGHTPGHMSLYFNKYKILLAGDLFVINNNSLELAPESLNYDNDVCIESVKKLEKLDIETLICYHGGVFTDNVNLSIKNINK